ncbi:replication initiation and membrane attachment family protein [Texcoconibacillus texcoconensis]|uniref:Replication initiation and membrane attachment protein n=1 Tax=Texcoconibacillus texcoconensis TaxID=1095777 RepID=A0A840QMX2_9BACI|nr:DnaD domain protein [Texcoconibacillus texcoconensis]MBB5172708.1 replication initiation and membrane attachment protein [Texcoconibacillus texcoconensis]
MHWKELLPIDKYEIYTRDRLHETDDQVLTLLYQPLIGAVALSLYLTFRHEASHDGSDSSLKTHKMLMIMTGRPLDELFQERKKLEAVGLLETYRREEDGESVYMYELYPPMSPDRFFQDDVLSVFLYNRLGKTTYRSIRDRFGLTPLPKDDEAIERVTRSFDEVFTSLKPTEMVASNHPETREVLHSNETMSFTGRNDHDTSFQVEGADFDFQALLHHLPAFVDQEQIDRDDVKTWVHRLAFVYQLSPIEMSRAVQEALLHDEKLNIEKLRKQVQLRYRALYGNEPPTLGMRVQPDHLRTMSENKAETELEKMVLFYETTPPLTMLEARSGGAKVPPQDAKIVEHLLLDYRLPPGVVNVLVDYVLMVNNQKLTQAFVDKIAGHWKRKKVETVDEAMKIAQEEYDARKQWKQAKSETSTSSFSKSASEKGNVRKEKLPKWLTEEEEEGNVQQQDDKEVEEAKETIEKLMKQYEHPAKKED